MNDLSQTLIGASIALPFVLSCSFATAAAPDTWPEYDQLWGFAGDPSRQKVVVYSFFGVDADEADPRDNGLVEYLRHQRTLRARLPGLRVVETAPHAWLLDFYVDGARVEGVTWDDVERWVIDGAGWPAVVFDSVCSHAIGSESEVHVTLSVNVPSSCVRVVSTAT